jgi:hypothetical protein
MQVMLEYINRNLTGIFVINFVFKIGPTINLLVRVWLLSNGIYAINIVFKLLIIYWKELAKTVECEM